MKESSRQRLCRKQDFSFDSYLGEGSWIEYFSRIQTLIKVNPKKSELKIKNVSNNCFKKYFNTLQSLLQRINIECTTGRNLSMKGQGLWNWRNIDTKRNRKEKKTGETLLRLWICFFWSYSFRFCILFKYCSLVIIKIKYLTLKMRLAILYFS